MVVGGAFTGPAPLPKDPRAMKDPNSESCGQLPQEGRNVSSLFGIVAAASQTLRTLLGDLWNDPKTTCNSEADAFNQLMHVYLGTYDPYMSK